jgi:hypothetical protein
MARFLTLAYDLPPASSPTFNDIAGTTFEREIRAVAAAGIAGGFPDGSYKPGQVVTRGQMARFIALAEKLDLNGPGPQFCDTAGTTFEREIRAIAAAGIAQGAGGCFNPNGIVNRGQMATFLAKALNL